jgi:DNA-directed RNA polymerase specialized sigma24 family protein
VPGRRFVKGFVKGFPPILRPCQLLGSPDGGPRSDDHCSTLHCTIHVTIPPGTLPESTATTSHDRIADATPSIRQAALQAAFRDLHGARLHGFCLLVALGDRAPAAAAASRALSAATHRLADLRHPERGAAWLRGIALRALSATGGRPREAEAVRRENLRGLGVTDAAFQALGSLSTRERAAFVASWIERFAVIDVEVILGADAAATRRIVDRARDRYLAVAESVLANEPAAANPHDGAPPGELAGRIKAVADRAVGDAWSAG